MTGKAKAVPEGYHTITPHIVVRDAPRAIEFYKKALGAELKGVEYTPDGKVMHATLKIGDSNIMLNDEFLESKCLSPQSLGGTSTTLHIYTEDVDAAFNQAVSAGAIVKMPLTDMFWGDRFGQVTDPFGHNWSLAAHKEDLTKEEIGQRARQFFEGMAKQQKSAAN
jgi:PhnB protein